MAYKINEDLYIGNTNKQLKDLLAHYGDTLPIGGIVNYDGSTVPEGYESVGNDYSTNEINTGKTWIDGKPIYRKVYTFDLPPNPVTAWNRVADLPTNFGKMIRLYGNLTDNINKNQKAIPYYETDSYYFHGLIIPNEGKLAYQHKGSANGGTCDLILEYTKTTD